MITILFWIWLCTAIFMEIGFILFLHEWLRSDFMVWSIIPIVNTLTLIILIIGIILYLVRHYKDYKEYELWYNEHYE